MLPLEKLIDAGTATMIVWPARPGSQNPEILMDSRRPFFTANIKITKWLKALEKAWQTNTELPFTTTTFEKAGQRV